MAVSVVEARRLGIKTATETTRNRLRLIHLDAAKGLADDQIAKREADRFFGGVYDLLGVIETRSNTLDPRDLDALDECLGDFCTGVSKIGRAIQNGFPTLKSEDFKCDSRVREFLKVRRPMFAWVPDDSPTLLKIARNIERDFMPNKAGIVFVIVLVLLLETIALLWNHLVPLVSSTAKAILHHRRCVLLP